MATGRAFNKVIRHTTMEFSFHNNQITNITYEGCPVNKGWTADNLLDVNTIETNDYNNWNFTPEQFQQKVLSQISFVEPIITEIAKCFDCDTFIQVTFGKNTYKIEVSDEDGETVITGTCDEYEIRNPESILKHYKSDTAFYRIVKQMANVEHFCATVVNFQTRRVLYTAFAENNHLEGHIASFDVEGNIGEFVTCAWDISLS